MTLLAEQYSVTEAIIGIRFSCNNYYFYFIFKVLWSR